MFFVYVLYSSKLSKRYGGTTHNLDKRINEHNAGRTIFTKGGIPWTLIYKENFETNPEARKRERFLKSGVGRKLLDEILSNTYKGSAS